MPKIVNHDTQRRIVAEAALRVIRQSGLEQATVRRIAEEAGLSPGSMRHYFSTQVELFSFCMNLFIERVEKRLEAFEFEGPLLWDLKRLLLQFLPVDDERTLEMEVWFAFHSKTLIYTELRRIGSTVQDGLYKASRFVVEELIKNKLSRPGMDIELETEKLYALIDGLAVHRLMQPKRLSVERLEYIVESHLTALCTFTEK
ncbi:TetR/AcrR family transcriptional regulator [Paenibacillus sp. FSL H7-0331]|uniref:TetR/AcrR family transcriptional regulator n=1 Tax=Paenibacillus sp. FSL H7-0331 TaxID=1920421 RepID=UPI00096CF7AC|nr:TetR family transcriptional regulator C-terminal domain-containing protein [Paenibacillus sp. FSL H7-0331]OMF06074.1 TetR family transcriptional regulator [Paenibacillus sp. FSL H7-0331]